MTATVATPPRLLSIGAVALAAGCSTETVRDHERRGLLHPIRVEGAEFRIYVPEDVERLKAKLAETRARREAARA